MNAPIDPRDDTVDLILDGNKGDFTVRPCRPALRVILEAEREKLIRYGRLEPPEQPEQGEQTDRGEQK